MDREIDRTVRRRRLVRRWSVVAATLAGLAWISVFGAHWLRPSVSRARIRTAVVERGDLEATVQASGVVIPALERVLSSPVEARVDRVLKQPGEVVRPGDAILELDTSSTRLQLEQLDEQLAQKQNERKERALELEQKLADLNGRIETQRLDLELARYQLAQRRKLHGDGLIAEEQLKQAEVAVRKAEITLRRLEEETEGARRATRARLDGLDLDARILQKQLDETRRQLELATTRIEEGGVLTRVVPQAGTTIQRGAELARIADLESFRVEATVSDAYASRLESGQSVRVLVDDDPLGARLATILPTIEDGTLRFVVELANPSHSKLRHNLRVDVLVVTNERNDVLRVRRGPYAQGGGLDRQVFVVDGDVARRTDVRFGLSGHEYLEAVAGLNEGDEVILSDMRDYLHASRIRIK